MSEVGSLEVRAVGDCIYAGGADSAQRGGGREDMQAARNSADRLTADLGLCIDVGLTTLSKTRPITTKYIRLSVMCIL